jgi:hypothetical protein
MNRDLAAVAALAASGLMLAGCGGSDDAAPQAAAARPAVSAAHTADLGLARAALVRSADVPESWATDPGSPRERCRAGGTFAGVSVLTASGSFTRGNVNIQQTVWLFRDAAAARTAWRAMDAPAGRACFRLQVSARVRDQDSEFVRPLRLVHQRRLPHGLRRSLLAGRISRIADGPFGPVQTEMAVKVDEIERLRGRGISTIVVVAAAEQPDPATVKWLVTVAGRRLNAVIAARPGS